MYKNEKVVISKDGKELIYTGPYWAELQVYPSHIYKIKEERLPLVRRAFRRIGEFLKGKFPDEDKDIIPSWSVTYPEELEDRQTGFILVDGKFGMMAEEYLNE